jgi:LPS export ABC transporter protein LptC
MRRTRLRAVLLVVVTGALIGIGFQVSRTVSSRHPSTLKDLGADFLPAVAQHIRDFRRIKVENGRTMWEITAKDAQYFDKDDAIVVREPRMTLFLEDGKRRAHISGSEGHITLNGKELRTVKLSGNVIVRLDDMELVTTEAVYDRARDLITSPGSVTVQGRTLNVTGRGMEVQVGPQIVRFLDEVHTVLRNNATTS